MAAPKGYVLSLIRNPWILATFSCLTVIGTTSLFAHYIWRTDIEVARLEFRDEISNTTDSIETKVNEYENLIRALALVANYRGLKATQQDWQQMIAETVPVRGRAAAVSLSLADYKIKGDADSAALRGKHGSGPAFFSRVISIDSDAPGKSLIGYDMGTDKFRREALQAARDSGTVTATSPVILARDQHVGATAGFLLIAPVYEGRMPTTVADRRARIRGFVVAAYRMTDLLNPILPRFANRIALSITDPTDQYAPQVYFESDEANPQALFQDRQGLLIGDRIWALAYQTTPDFSSSLHKQHTLRIIAAGLLLALLVASLVWRLTRSWDLAEARVHGVSGELRRYQTLLRTVLDVIPEPVLVKNRNFQLILVNQAYADRAGLPIEDLIGRETTELVAPELAKRLVEADKAVFESHRDQVLEVSLPNRGLNSVRNYIATKRLAYDADGNPIMIGIHSDVTILRRKIAEFAAVIEQTPLVAVQGFDRNCVLTHWNKASESLFGYTAAQAVGSRLQDLVLESRMQRVFENLVEESWQRKEAFGPREIMLHLRDGRRIVLLLTLFPVVVEGIVLEMFSMAVDVSARHEAERLLAMHRDNLQVLVDERTAGLLRAKQALEQALQARSEFLANMSHELRTPMHAVLSFARLGEERSATGSPDKLRDYFARIAMSGDRLLALINNLLDLSKLEAGKMVLNWRDTGLVGLIHEVAAELEPLVEKKTLTLALPPHEPEIKLEVDAERVRQVLSNLLSNAIRFSPIDGCIVVHLEWTTMRIGRRATDSIESPAVKLSVKDQGPGIPAGELELIFDKFMQSSTTRTGAGGTGLGLAICREIVHAHQGVITANNRAEGGAVFEVLLPSQMHEIAGD